jgi:Asp-tRNA(Asn)/Glu-tRNA(Gln) amidotransferase A subunit family amidase
MLQGLARKVRARTVAARELVERSLQVIERRDGELNAVVRLRAEEALVEADAVDVAVARGERLGPLAGLPLLVKEAHAVAGWPSSGGSLVFADAPPATRDCLHVARLRAAGAIVVGRTNIPEFCFEGFTANLLFGVTRNPWAPAWSPGGSSGGSAAALAAGMAPLATASDGGGSIRIPASFCGLAGIKPTHGLVARDGAPSWMDFTTDGPLATTIADLRLLLAVEAGPAAGDPAALPAGAADLSPGQSLPRRVVAAPRFADWGPLPVAVADLFADALQALEAELGLSVEPLEPAEVLRSGNIDADWTMTAAVEQAHEFGREWIEANADRFHPAFLGAMRFGLGASLEDYLAARRRRFAYVRELDELLGGDAVLVTPTMTVEGFPADGDLPGEDEPGTPWSAYNTQAQNVTGHPALTVPAGVCPNGVPFGLQITGPRFGDGMVLALGAAWERARPWLRAAPGYEEFDAG